MGTYVIKIMGQNFCKKKGVCTGTDNGKNSKLEVLTIAKADHFLVLTIATNLRKGGPDNCKGGPFFGTDNCKSGPFKMYAQLQQGPKKARTLNGKNNN